MSHLKKFIIKAKTAAETIKAVSVLNLIIGTINPAHENPLKVKADTVTLGAKIVKRYKRMAFVIKEKSPRVIIFKGREKMFIIGFTIILRIVRIMPAAIKV